jgi:hypothetical protein
MRDLGTGQSHTSDELQSGPDVARYPSALRQNGILGQPAAEGYDPRPPSPALAYHLLIDLSERDGADRVAFLASERERGVGHARAEEDSP